jgi:serine O-acetyltransferase
MTNSLSPCVAMYRAANWLHRRGVRVLPAVLRSLSVALYSADISPSAEIGPGLRLPHTVGVVIGEVRAGRNLCVYQNVTLGGRGFAHVAKDGRWSPVIGDDVTVGAGAIVLGPVTVGDGATIGANVTVVRDVSPNETVVG